MIAELRDCEIAELQDRGIAELRDCEIAELQDRGSAELRDCEIAELQDRGSAELRDCEISELRDCEIAEIGNGDNGKSPEGIETRHSTNSAISHFRNFPFPTLAVDKIGSATSPLSLSKTVAVVSASCSPRAGDVVVVRALTDSATYNMLELPAGRLAKINPGDLLMGVLGRRRALKGFVGDVPASVQSGDKLHLLNMGGVIGCCTGHHSSLGDAIELEVRGLVCDEFGQVLNIASAALPPRTSLGKTAPIVMIAGTSMNSGKTYAATELIKQATRAGLKVAAAKLSGIACLRDTLNMADHGAVVTASFLDCGLPSTVDIEDLAPTAKAIIARLNEVGPDLIVIEMGDGILGGYSVDTIFGDIELREATAALVFCASDYVGAWGGIELLRRRGVEVDVISGSVTDSQMGGDYIKTQFGVPAANARREGAALFELVKAKVEASLSPVNV